MNINFCKNDYNIKFRVFLYAAFIISINIIVYPIIREVKRKKFNQVVIAGKKNSDNKLLLYLFINLLSFFVNNK
jgi:hypothetical protein